jgi:hypothetical protein
MFEVYVFKEGDDDNPANNTDEGESNVNDSFGAR